MTEGSERLQDDRQPTVSVVVPTFNQERSIEKCLQSILGQQTDFDVEVVVGDDASNDRTLARIQTVKEDLEEGDRERLRVLAHTKNRGPAFAPGKRNFASCLEESRGEFVAVCEGDDEWNDPFKLQRQVDLMRADLELVACTHQVYVRYLDGPREAGTPEVIPNREQDCRIAYEQVFQFSGGPVCSLLFRRSAIPWPLPTSFWKVKSGDRFLMFLLAIQGPLLYVAEPMATYNSHSSGSVRSGGWLHRVKFRTTFLEGLLALDRELPSDLDRVPLARCYVERLGMLFDLARRGGRLTTYWGLLLHSWFAWRGRHLVKDRNRSAAGQTGPGR